jgi:hypothetical protein
MSYNALRPLTPDDIPELATALDRNLRVAHLRLDQFKVDPTITRDQAQTGVAFFAEVVAQNDRYTASIKGWMRLRRIPAGQVREARRLIRLMAQINRVVAKLTVMAAKVAETGPVRPPPFVILPLSDLADITRVTNANIIDARRDIKILAQTASSSLPFVTRKDLVDAAAQYRHALSLTEVFPFQYRRWRRSRRCSVGKYPILRGGCGCSGNSCAKGFRSSTAWGTTPSIQSPPPTLPGTCMG